MLNSNLTQFKLAVCCPCVDDGTSLVRGEGPLGAMSRRDRRLQIEHAPESNGQQMLSWSWIHRNDALFLQRPFRPVDVRAAVHARMMQRPVWVDWDDDLTAVPLHSPYAHLYDATEMRRNIGKLLSLADVVTVTTEHLRARMEEVAGQRSEVRSQKIQVIPNACHWPFSTAQRQRRVTWRGGKSHNEDVLEFLPAIAELARLPQFSLWQWCFLGDVPWQVREAIPEGRLEVFAEDAFHYMPSFGYLGPWVNMVPLQDSLFNRSKSNLAWIEGTCAGAITLAPDWPEWQRPGIHNYKSKADFGQELRAILECFIEGHPPAPLSSRKFITDNLLLDDVNARRWEIINAMAENQKSEGRGQRAETGSQKSELEVGR